MSGQSQSSQKGGAGQSPYGYQPFSFGQQGYGNPAQQGSYFSNGGSSRPQFGQGSAMGGMMDTGSQFGSPFTGNYGNFYSAFAPNGFGGPSGGGSYGAPQGGYKPAPYNPANDVLGGSSGGGGVPNPQVGNQPNQNGLVFTNGQYGFGNGSLAQISPGTAAFLGYRDNGQGQWVNAQGQVVGLSGGGGGGGMLK